MKKNYETLYYFFERERKEIKRDKRKRLSGYHDKSGTTLKRVKEKRQTNENKFRLKKF